MADQFDHFVNVCNGDGQTHQYLRALPRLGQFKPGAPGDDFLAEGHKRLDVFAQVQHYRPAFDERQHIEAEIALQTGEPIDLVHHDFRGGIAADLDHYPQPFATGFIAQF